ncbi:MAG: NADH-quinone oxidoreductase subunit C [Thermoplasmatales archaeon]|jgi:NADH-quinone oxidoreductase subunit C|nr:NADH-quinone oxidoreductase subunit C [Thermoplasmatales archaeon]MCW6169679.1 NADH-quinone oxidoreductase subunit C [Thermoplasmatales archaeon]
MVEVIEESIGKDGRKVIKVAKENLIALMKDLKSQGYDHLSLITGIDRKDKLEVVYHLHNMKEDKYLVIKTETLDERVPSLTSLYSSADWDEREQYDLMGIVFEGHPNLKRLFLPESWVGHPLRKNYDLSKVQYINMDENGDDYATFDPGDGW